ncbi:Aldo/keto reductase [Abortiporus biennis]|nr:Aldo/keto reductase [Abortiporus biennis]
MSSFWTPLPPPKTPLGYYRQLAPNAGVHVSPIQLGAMSIGSKWNKEMGAMDKESSFKLLDAYYEAGGNFIDTANFYQDESSEEFIGEWIEKRGIRDQLVISTKYTGNFKRDNPAVGQKVHYAGNSSKSMYISLEASLKKLRTTYIDIFYVHWWDYTTTIEEVMNGLHHLVAQGKVLYLGIADAPAWVVAKANTYARLTFKTPFVIYQGAWSILQRDLEREVIPMVREEGMALAPFSVLAEGRIRSDAEEQKRRESGEKGRMLLSSSWERSESEVKISRALERVGAEVGAKTVAAVAIAYVMQKYPYVFPIVGGRKVEHLQANIEALNISLTNAHIKYLENILPFDVGFPQNFMGDGSEYIAAHLSAGNLVKWPRPEPIRPLK